MPASSASAAAFAEDGAMDARHATDRSRKSAAGMLSRTASAWIRLMLHILPCFWQTI